MENTYYKVGDVVTVRPDLEDGTDYCMYLNADPNVPDTKNESIRAVYDMLPYAGKSYIIKEISKDYFGAYFYRLEGSQRMWVDEMFVPPTFFEESDSPLESLLK